MDNTLLVSVVYSLLIVIVGLWIYRCSRLERKKIMTLWAAAVASNPEMLNDYRSHVAAFSYLSTSDSTVLAGYGGTQEEMERQLKVMREVIKLIDNHLS